MRPIKYSSKNTLVHPFGHKRTKRYQIELQSWRLKFHFVTLIVCILTGHRKEFIQFALLKAHGSMLGRTSLNEMNYIWRFTNNEIWLHSYSLNWIRCFIVSLWMVVTHSQCCHSEPNLSCHQNRIAIMVQNSNFYQKFKLKWIRFVFGNP